LVGGSPIVVKARGSGGGRESCGTVSILQDLLNRGKGKGRKKGRLLGGSIIPSDGVARRKRDATTHLLLLQYYISYVFPRRKRKRMIDKETTLTVRPRKPPPDTIRRYWKNPGGEKKSLRVTSLNDALKKEKENGNGRRLL